MIQPIRPRRILFLLPFPPDPDGLHGGTRAIGQLLRGISEVHEAGVLYLRGPDEPAINPTLVPNLAFAREVRVRPASTPLAAWKQRFRILAGLARSSPIWVTCCWSTAFAEELERVIEEWKPDLIQVDFHVMGQYLPPRSASGIPTVLVQHDPGVAAAAAVAEKSTGLRRIVARWDVAAWRRYEPMIMSRASAIVAFTERDQEILAGATSTPVFRIPLTANLPAEPLDPVGSEDGRLLFVGNFGHPPNVDAALRLVRDILPEVRRGGLSARLDLVGDNPPPELRELASPVVNVTGRVPDVAPYLDRASLVVVPLRMGGGMRVKVLEALGAGKAVVASRLATEGLDLVDGLHVVHAETDGEFALRIREYLQDVERRRALATNARVWALDNLGHERRVAEFVKLYEAVLEHPVDRVTLDYRSLT